MIKQTERAPDADLSFPCCCLLLPAGRITRLKDNSLQINNISRKDRGSYTCGAKIKDRPIFKKLVISIFVNGGVTQTKGGNKG